MFRDMGQLAPEHEDALYTASVAWLTDALAREEYVGWVCDRVPAGVPEVVAGAGMQLRGILPRVLDTSLYTGLEAIVVNVYVEPEWRRRGFARRLMQTLMHWARERGIERVVLHASRDGRALYEELGFVQTNEMRLEG